MAKKTRTVEPKVTTERVGDVVRVTKVYEYPAEIPFSALLDACTVEPDQDCREPWKEQDGYEHDFVRHDYLPHEDYDKQAGWVSGRFGHRDGVVFLKDDCEDVFKYFRGLGMSKQMARERQAQSKKHILERIVRYYEKGWYVFGVVCEFRGHHASVWGIEVDDEFGDDPYIDETKEDMAEEVAGELEKDGYVITGRPVTDPFTAFCRRTAAWHLTNDGGISRERLRELWEKVYGKEHVLLEVLR